MNEKTSMKYKIKLGSLLQKNVYELDINDVIIESCKDLQTATEKRQCFCVCYDHRLNNTKY